MYIPGTSALPDIYAGLPYSKIVLFVIESLKEPNFIPREWFLSHDQVKI